VLVLRGFAWELLRALALPRACTGLSLRFSSCSHCDLAPAIRIACPDLCCASCARSLSFGERCCRVCAAAVLSGLQPGAVA
jgi:hypothetical protein